MASFSAFACETLPNELAAAHLMALVNNTDFEELLWWACSASREQNNWPCTDMMIDLVDWGWAYDGHLPSWVQVNLIETATVSQVDARMQNLRSQLYPGVDHLQNNIKHAPPNQA